MLQLWTAHSTHTCAGQSLSFHLSTVSQSIDPPCAVSLGSEVGVHHYLTLAVLLQTHCLGELPESVDIETHMTPHPAMTLCAYCMPHATQVVVYLHILCQCNLISKTAALVVAEIIHFTSGAHIPCRKVPEFLVARNKLTSAIHRKKLISYELILLEIATIDLTGKEYLNWQSAIT